MFDVCREPKSTTEESMRKGLEAKNLQKPETNSQPEELKSDQEPSGTKNLESNEKKIS